MLSQIVPSTRLSITRDSYHPADWYPPLCFLASPMYDQSVRVGYCVVLVVNVPLKKSAIV